ncbi:MAG: DNA starvation/stationary phase protection protein [Ferruginibacter sp.]|nr:DNA starvation/stationary phase protection protein [Ferruginibacter sp.]
MKSLSTPKGSNKKKLATMLNELLADYMMFYQNTRGLHWNIKGEKFFELHAKFEELYTNLLVKIDEIGERILTLGEQPYHTFSDFIAYSKIKAVKNVSDARKSAESVINGLEEVLKLQNTILNASAEAGDEGTNALMSDYIAEQEKLLWMYKAYCS